MTDPLGLIRAYIRDGATLTQKDGGFILAEVDRLKAELREMKGHLRRHGYYVNEGDK